jgi:hypothetical protein
MIRTRSDGFWNGYPQSLDIDISQIPLISPLALITDIGEYLAGAIDLNEYSRSQTSQRDPDEGLERAMSPKDQSVGRS